MRGWGVRVGGLRTLIPAVALETFAVPGAGSLWSTVRLGFKGLKFQAVAWVLVESTANVYLVE